MYLLRSWRATYGVSKITISDLKITYTPSKHIPMHIPKPKQNRFQMSYRRPEADAFLEMEQSLMKDLCIPTRCELHRTAIKNMYQQRQQLMLNLL